MIERIEPNDMPGRATSYNNPIRSDVLDFLATDWPIAEVRTEKYKTVGSACCAYRNAVKKVAPDQVAVTERSGRLFLIRK